MANTCGGAGAVQVIFTATDAAGNTSSTSATFTIQDTTAPSITVAAQDTTTECDGSGNAAELAAWLANNGGATASETCSNVTWTNNFTSLSNLCGETGARAVTFTATDACGNAASSTATFTIEDTTAPTITAPASDLTVECDGAGNTSDLNTWLANFAGCLLYTSPSPRD